MPPSVRTATDTPEKVGENRPLRRPGPHALRNGVCGQAAANPDDPDGGQRLARLKEGELTVSSGSRGSGSGASGNLAVDIAAVTDGPGQDPYDQPAALDGVDDAVVADPEPPSGAVAL
jgi:hypothetical protein